MNQHMQPDVSREPPAPSSEEAAALRPTPLPELLDETHASVLEKAHALAIQNLPNAIFHLKVEGQDRYRFADANPAYFGAITLPREQVIGKLVQEVLHGQALQDGLRNYAAAIRSGTTQRWEEISEVPAGKRIVEVSITPVYNGEHRCSDLLGTMQDITAYRDRERSLKEAVTELTQLTESIRVSEQRLNFALEGMGEGLWDWWIKSGKVHYSKQWKQLVGLPEDFAGDDLEVWLSRVHREDLPHLLERMEECMSAPDHKVCNCEYRMRRESGEYLWVQCRASIMERAQDGSPARMIGTLADITENIALRQQLEASHTMLAQLTEHVPGALFKLVRTADGEFTCPYISSRAEELFEVSPPDIMRDPAAMLRRVIYGDRDRLVLAREKSASSLCPWRVEFQVELPKQGKRWVELNATPRRERNGDTEWHGFLSDITQRKSHELTIRQFNETLERRANYDTLTGLPNRALFRDRLEHGMRQSREAKGTLALMFIDLDRFKEVNDLLGHNVGDKLLVDAARRISGCVRPGDTVSRLGGDEFTVILTETHELEHIEQIAQQIQNALAMPFQLGVEQAHVSGSIGIACFPDDGATPEELMRNADHAMYRSKMSGRNQITFFEVSMQAAAMHRLKLASDLRRALPDKQLQLYFQPIVDMATGRIVKAEALLRWARPGSEGLVLPGQFVDVAEESGFIHDIGNWAFTTAAQCAHRWTGMLGYPFQISINKSPAQFHQASRGVNWSEYLRELGLPPNCISVEITEGLLLNLSEKVVAKLAELHAGGIEVAIDDFGTGYSSMNYLKRLDIDYLKIDQSFVAEMLHDPSSQTITETIIVMAHKLGLKVIAEGVETPEQRDWLGQRQCDFAQGFLFGAPIEAAAFEAMLRQPVAAYH